MNRVPALLVVALACVASGGCASTPAAPPQPGEVRGGLPALSGQGVMVLPIQRNAVTGPVADDELGFALAQRLPSIDWVGPAELTRLMEQAPVMDSPLDRLPIDAFFVSEVTRVGDPVYGVLRRTAALADADFALIPLALTAAPVVEGAGEGLSLMATLLEIRTGRVLWLATVGAEGAPASPGTLAALMEELARSLQPAAGGIPNHIGSKDSR